MGITMDTSCKLALVAATSIAGAALIAGLVSGTPVPLAVIDAIPPETVCPSESTSGNVTFCVHV
jgi:hypothetical protein